MFPLLPNDGGPVLDLATQILLIGLPCFCGVFGGYFLVRAIYTKKLWRKEYRTWK